MASIVSSLSPIPAFPEYGGPYKVGTVDVEIPVAELDAPSSIPDGADQIHTVLCRIFYPATPESRGKRVSWLPAPQRLHIAAYTQFLGAGPTLASILSFLPRHLHWTSIPAIKNATLLRPRDGPHARWPTMIFSHGLGGNRNAYSHLAGSLASYGVVVVCPEHRDGSAALSLIRDPESQDHKRARHMVPYQRIPHLQTNEVWEARNKQLRIRLWELGLIYEAISALDAGDKATIKANLNHSTPVDALSQFANQLDVLEPGKVIFAGHSFGAVTIVQLLKSTFYADHPAVASMAVPLFRPYHTSALAQQVTPHNPTILLDMWCFPLLSASTAALHDLPLPCYHQQSSDPKTPPPPGGAGLLAIESQAFFDWTEHLHVKARILSPQPTARVVTADMFITTPTSTTTTNTTTATTAPDSNNNPDTKLTRPYFYYVASSAHLNQSDFGLLFPWLTRRVFKADAPPARVLRLNLRGVLQFLRERGVRVERTRGVDLVDGPLSSVASAGKDGEGEGGGEGRDDAVILGQNEVNGNADGGDSNGEGKGESGGKVEAWRWIDVVGLGAEAYPSELEMAEGKGDEREARAEEGEREMQGEIEPSLETGAEAAAVVNGVRQAVAAH